MKIVIPMSGLGQRFVDAGYPDIKPLIPVHGKPIIEHVVNMFSPEDDFLFIVRDHHAERTPVLDVLGQLVPDGAVKIIKGHKLGPVHAVNQVTEMIADDEQVIVNYCDFFMNWNYQGFKEAVKDHKYHGSVPCYTGFHPHLLHEKNLYASCLVDDQSRLVEIREKFSFESDKTQSLHSPGTYYFDTGKLMKAYFKKLVDQQDSLNGEFYVSMVYNNMVKDGLDVLVYTDVPYFCQWGTPFDLEEYLYWSEIFN